ncbi:hypothetical protein DP107_12180 [Haloglomus irregulare]|uniref:Uncharacterized protein n=1 Tax=Haloglomus irregulare TaxID=2234134 RepID=A0A554N841_9EURY|nr:hypothetical protein [Haloglomus irregulare]TSD13566.1 hypothetical protein DP107_12180 [Haloglomus irregulare]
MTKRQVRRVLAVLAEAGYIRTVRADPGVAKAYEPAGAPGAGEASLPDQEEAVDATPPGQAPSKEYYTWNVRVVADLGRGDGPPAPAGGPAASGPPAPSAVGGLRPPD